MARVTTDALDREFAKAYRAGLTIRQVAERYGYSASVVQRSLARAGQQSRPRGGGQRLPHETFQTTALLYRAGLSMNEISALLGVHYNSIRHRLIQAGEPRRPPGAASAPGKWLLLTRPCGCLAACVPRKALLKAFGDGAAITLAREGFTFRRAAKPQSAREGCCTSRGRSA